MQKLLIVVYSFFVLNTSFADSELRSSFFNKPQKHDLSNVAYKAYDNYHFKIPFFAGIAAYLLFDGDVSDSASENNYIFGSQKNAADWTDGLLLSLIPVMLYTGYNTDIPYNSETKTTQKIKLLALQSLIIAADILIIHGIKTSSQRVRPDASDKLSFPSGHSSVSAGLSRTIFNNVKNSSLNGTNSGNIIQGTSFAMSSLVAWGRVEAKKHHLSDVLLGNALGSFISDFMYGIFLEKPKNLQTTIFINDKKQAFNLVYNF
jgi:membrane-associated phospholipid phosphatase